MPREIPMIHLGFEVGTGKPISIPLHHLCVTGITQLSGKTTTLEALISRSGLRALAFITKRGESGFSKLRTVIPPFFREERGWQFYEGILEAAVRERLKFERGRIMRASKGADTLQDFHLNVRRMLAKARGGIDQEILTRLDEYCEIVLPQLGRVKFSQDLRIAPGMINVMDLSVYSTEVQSLVIYSSIVDVFDHMKNVVLVIPEANEFIPQGRGSPVKLAALRFIRKGGAIGNWIFLDTQDIAGVDKEHLKQVGVYLLGVQREINEVRRTLAHIPQSVRLKPSEIQSLKLGEFFVCFGGVVKKVYVQPSWMEAEQAKRVSLGQSVVRTFVGTGEDTRNIVVPHGFGLPINLEEFADRGIGAQEAVNAILDREIRAQREEEEVCTKCPELERKVSELTMTTKSLQRNLGEEFKLVQRERGRAERVEAEAKVGNALVQALRAALGGTPSAGTSVHVVDEDSIVSKVLSRIPAAGGIIQVIPPEKLRKDFQQEEVQRILATIEALSPLQKKMLKLIETTDGTYISRAMVAQRLGRSTGGGSFIDLSRGLSEMCKLGVLEMQERQGVRKALRTKIQADLEFYKASDAEVEQVYNSVLHVLATEG